MACCSSHPHLDPTSPFPPIHSFLPSRHLPSSFVNQTQSGSDPLFFCVWPWVVVLLPSSIASSFCHPSTSIKRCRHCQSRPVPHRHCQPSVKVSSLSAFRPRPSLPGLARLHPFASSSQSSTRSFKSTEAPLANPIVGPPWPYSTDQGPPGPSSSSNPTLHTPPCLVWSAFAGLS